jgi:hypothetical protein
LSIDAIYPAPLQERAQIVVTTPASADLRLRLIDARGTVMRETNWPALVAGRHVLAIDVRGIASGLYRLTTQAGERIAAQTVPIIR